MRPSKRVGGDRRRKKKYDIDELAKTIIKRQLSNVQISRKLSPKDIVRICKNINRSIFDRKKCCLWHGHVTNMNNLNKGRYVNFYFRRKKVALHRLLYVNFVGELSDDEYLKFSCDNKGICCNTTHLKRFKYQKVPDKSTETSSQSGSSSSQTSGSAERSQLSHGSGNRKGGSGSRSSTCTPEVVIVSSFIRDEDYERHKEKLTLRFSDYMSVSSEGSSPDASSDD
jgi:hypothetical protein